jgi:hypothetical protein
MSNLKLIEALCELVEMQAVIIRRLSRALMEANAYTEAQAAMVAKAQKEYTDILGADEAPDFLS